MSIVPVLRNSSAGVVEAWSSVPVLHEAVGGVPVA
jgi:hypothetical protein